MVVTAAQQGKQTALNIHMQLTNEKWEQLEIRKGGSYGRFENEFSIPITNPLWLASAPPTNFGYQVQRAFEAGWEAQFENAW